MKRITRKPVKTAVLATAALASIGLASGCSGKSQAATPAPSKLVGTFHLAAGHCSTKTATPTGSYLIVIAAAADKPVLNKNGGCANPAYTPLTPGKDGGLVTGKFQNEPDPTFDAHRNALATDIIKPVEFGNFALSLATSAKDEQDAPTGPAAFPVPVAQVTGSQLSIDLRSLVLLYGGYPSSTCAQHYGTGCWELGSVSAGGTYDAATHAFVIQWFTGESFVPQGDSLEFHLAGTFTPAA